MGIVWDFMSLPQRGYTQGYDPDSDDRTESELARFGMGLKNINVWYGHHLVTTLVLDWPMPADAENAAPVEKRGWCVFERRLSSITKASACCLTLGRMPDDVRNYFQLIRTCVGGHLAPLTPDAFARMMRDGMATEKQSPGCGLRFTNGKDATAVCIPQYETGFKRLFANAEAMNFGGCRWGDEELASLAAALAWADDHGATTRAATLALNGNAFTDVSFSVLVDALESGVMPELKHLYLEENQISDLGAQKLAAALADGKLPKLQKLWLNGNKIGDAGVYAFSHAELEDLELDRNQISDLGAQKLAAALADGKLPKLETLWLHGNKIGDAGMSAFSDAIRAAPALKALKLGNNTNSDTSTEVLLAMGATHGVHIDCGIYPYSL